MTIQNVKPGWLRIPNVEKEARCKLCKIVPHLLHGGGSNCKPYARAKRGILKAFIYIINIYLCVPRCKIWSETSTEMCGNLSLEKYGIWKMYQ